MLDTIEPVAMYGTRAASSVALVTPLVTFGQSIQRQAVQLILGIVRESLSQAVEKESLSAVREFKRRA